MRVAVYAANQSPSRHFPLSTMFFETAVEPSRADCAKTPDTARKYRNKTTTQPERIFTPWFLIIRSLLILEHYGNRAWLRKSVNVNGLQKFSRPSNSKR